MTRLDVNKKKRILVALSGGVDSSVAAALLQRDGSEIEGAYMRCWSEGPYCSSDQDQADAARVASQLGIPFHVFDFEKQYKEKVIEYFFSEYEAGRTPNPDVMCNKEIKFGIFLQKAIDLGFDFVATGHYAQVHNGSGYHLLRGIDKNKDQSYFLYRIGQEQLARTLFPIGKLTKPEVRKLAKKFGLPTAEKKDSTGICFVGPTDVREFLAQRIKNRQGDVVNVDGRLLGKHRGLAFYTIGQREGIGISESVPHYVVDKIVASNNLVVAPIGHKALFKEKIAAKDVHLVNEKKQLPKKLSVKLRYRAGDVAANVTMVGGRKAEILLSLPQRAVTPGQSVVFYKGKELLGGAIIDEVIS